MLQAFAGRPVIEQRPAQIIDDIVGNQATAVEALVDDGPFLADLGKEIAVEIGVAADVGVCQVDIGQAASAHALDFTAIVVDPA